MAPEVETTRPHLGQIIVIDPFCKATLKLISHSIKETLKSFKHFNLKNSRWAFRCCEWLTQRALPSPLGCELNIIVGRIITSSEKFTNNNSLATEL
jgi:hypothetical protein